MVHRFRRSLVDVTAATAALGLALVWTGCTGHRAASRFSVPGARTHVEMLAGTLGIHPVGTDTNRRAREYLVDQLTRSGFRVHVQQAEARRPGFGLTVRVSNVVGVLPGLVPDAIALVSHYDSTPDGPGAADDGLGVAVCLEAGRTLAGRPARRHTLIVALTDAEEIGLMGAEALVQDPAWQQVRAYLNFEAVGTSGPSALFETGPGNTWLVKAWALNARSPFGGSFATEIYKRLNNDTDFTVLKRSGAPGLNFAPIGNSYAYHTPLDTPDRLSDETIRSTGDNAVAICDALDGQDLGQRSADSTLFFDIGGLGAVAVGSWVVGLLTVLALVAGVAAWIKMFLASRSVASLGRLLVTALWAVAGLIAALGLMVAAAWGLRAAREVYNPWYAHPNRFFALLVAAGVCGWWGVGRFAAMLPARLRPLRHPAMAWCGLLALWMALAAATTRWAPAASYLATIPLLAAGLALISVGAQRGLAIRLASLVPLVVAGLLWTRLANGLMHFMVPMFGRLPLVTPPYVYPALLLVAGVFVVAPALPLICGWQTRWAQPSLVTAAALLAFIATFSWAYLAPAYSVERPMYRSAQYIQDSTMNAAFWEIGGNEPGVDLEAVDSAPRNWTRVTDAAPVSVPMDRPGGPFRFRAPAEAGLVASADVSATLDLLATEARLEVTVQPRLAGATVAFYLPAGVTPRDANFPGVVRGRRWRAIYSAPPQEGVTFRVTLRLEDQAALPDTRVAVLTQGLPGGSGPLRLPPWMPRDRVAWRARTVSILPLSITRRDTAR